MIGNDSLNLEVQERFYYDGIGIGKMKLSDFEIHPFSDDIVLAAYRIYSEVSNQHSLRSSIWKLNEGVWKIVFHQGKTKPLD